MKNSSRLLLCLGGALLGAATLSSCFPSPVPDPGISLTFKLPDGETGQNLMLAAYYLGLDNNGKVVPKLLNQSGFYNGTSNYFYLNNFQKLSSNADCTTPFATGEARDMKNVTITPSDVKTCGIFFVAYQDGNGNQKPEEGEVKYVTHDIYSYASSAFTYSMTTPNGVSTESGSRAAGWSLVRHVVLEPVATPGNYLVSMNSVPTEDLGLPIVLHKDSNFFTSMSLGTVGGKR